MDLPARVGLTGVLLPDDFEPIEIGPVRIRRSDERDDWVVAGTTLTGSIGAVADDGQAVQIDYAGNIVLETTSRYRIKLARFNPGQDWPLDLVELRQSLEAAHEDVRLALALSMPPGSPAMVIGPSWIATVDLLATGQNVSWYDPGRAYRLHPRQLDLGKAAAWGKWIERVQNTTTRKRIEIATRRLLLASGERLKPDDVLIDAVIVWENLFGAPGEATLRISGALACLLAASIEEREKLKMELAKIYDLRSKIVHGSTQLSAGDQPKVDRALQIATDALRVLFESRPDLIAQSDGAARSTRLLLGG